MSIAPRSPMSESLATIPWDGAESKEVYGRGSIRARFHEGGGGGGVSRLPIRRQKKAAKAMTATMIKTPATMRTVFPPPGSNGFDGGLAEIVMLPHMVVRTSPGPAERSPRSWNGAVTC